MAIVLDKTLGGLANDTGATTIALTTTNAVAPGGFIVLGVTTTLAISLSSVADNGAGGSLVYAINKSGASTFFNLYIVSAQAPSGLASGTVITATLSGTATGRSMVGVSFTGVASSSALDTTSGPTAFTGGNWTTASTSILAGSVLVAFSVDQDTGASSTITSPSVEDGDFPVAGGFAVTLGHRLPGVAGATTVAGTWGAADTGSVIAAAYKVASTVPAPQGQSVWPIMLSRTFRVGQPRLGFPPQAIVLTTPTVFNQSLDAVVSSTSSFQLQTNKKITAVVTTLSSIQKQVSKFLTATTSLITGSIQKQVNKPLTATVSSTAFVATKKIASVLMTAVISSTASITKQVNKLLTATVTTTASLTNQVNKPLTATVTTTASIVKKVLKNLTATVTVTAILTSIKVILQTLTAVVSSTASIQKQVNKSLTALLSLSSTIQKQVNKALVAPVTLSASMVKKVLKNLTAGISVLGIMDAVRGGVVFFQTLTATVTSTAVLTKQVNKLLIAPISVAGTLTKKMFVSLTAVVSVNGSILAALPHVARRVAGIITFGRF